MHHLNPGEIVHLLSILARFACVWENFFSRRTFTIVAEYQKECGSW